LPARMVNYHDPAVLAQDACAYAFVARLCSSESLSNPYFCRGYGEVLPHCGRYLHVGLAPRGARPSYNVHTEHGVNSIRRLSAGSSSLISTMNGVSSKGVVLTIGQYGSVMTGTWLQKSLANYCPSLDLLFYAYRYPRMHYPQHRWVCLYEAIRLSGTHRLRKYFYRAPLTYDSKVWIDVEIVSTPLHSPRRTLSTFLSSRALLTWPLPQLHY
jgi:hypothetical protein